MAEQQTVKVSAPAPAPDPSFLRMQYELTLQRVIHHDQLRWVLFGAFSVVEGLLVQMLIDVTPEWRWPVALMGIVATGFWLLATWRVQIHLVDGVYQAVAMQARLGAGDEDIHFWDGKGNFPSSRLRALRNGAGPLWAAKVVARQITYWRLLGGLILLASLCWAYAAWTLYQS